MVYSIFYLEGGDTVANLDRHLSVGKLIQKKRTDEVGQRRRPRKRRRVSNVLSKDVLLQATEDL